MAVFRISMIPKSPMKNSMPTRTDTIIPAVDFPSCLNRLFILIVKKARIITGTKRRWKYANTKVNVIGPTSQWEMRRELSSCYKCNMCNDTHKIYGIHGSIAVPVSSSDTQVPVVAFRAVLDVTLVT